MNPTWVHLLEMIGGVVAGAALILGTIICVELFIDHKERKQLQEKLQQQRIARLEHKASMLEIELTAVSSQVAELNKLWNELDQAEIPL